MRGRPLASIALSSAYGRTIVGSGALWTLLTGNGRVRVGSKAEHRLQNLKGQAAANFVNRSDSLMPPEKGHKPERENGMRVASILIIPICCGVIACTPKTATHANRVESSPLAYAST